MCFIWNKLASRENLSVLRNVLKNDGYTRHLYHSDCVYTFSNNEDILGKFQTNQPCFASLVNTSWKILRVTIVCIQRILRWTLDNFECHDFMYSVTDPIMAHFSSFCSIILFHANKFNINKNLKNFFTRHSNKICTRRLERTWFFFFRFRKMCFILIYYDLFLLRLCFAFSFYFSCSLGFFLWFCLPLFFIGCQCFFIYNSTTFYTWWRKNIFFRNVSCKFY